MHGLSEAERSATTRLHEQLSGTRVGERWERMLRAHAHEVEAVLAVHPDVQANVAAALALLASDSLVDDATCRAVERVIDDLQRFAGVPLQRDLTRMRDELHFARGRTLDEVLAG